MPLRTTRSQVTFVHPFQIDELSELQPPGDYRVDIDEELIEGLSFLAYRRVAALVHLPALARSQDAAQVIAMPPARLDALLDLDRGHH